MNDFDFDTQDNSANMTEVADPSGSSSDGNAAAGGIGEEAQEITAPAEADAGADPGETPAAPQSKEENARYAAARRKAEAERDAAIARAKEDSERQILDVLRAAGLRDPHTGGLIETVDGLRSWQKQQAEAQKQQAMARLGVDEAGYQSFVDALPEVAAAKQQQQAAEEARREAARQRAEQEISAQLKEIGKLDPAVKSMADLAASDSYDRIMELLRKGNSLLDSYKLANMDKLTAQGSQRARQAAMNAQAGKAHLSATTQRGGGDAPVPADVKEMYRSLMPELSDAEIAREYNRQLKK